MLFHIWSFVVSFQALLLQQLILVQISTVLAVSLRLSRTDYAAIDVGTPTYCSENQQIEALERQYSKNTILSDIDFDRFSIVSGTSEFQTHAVSDSVAVAISAAAAVVSNSMNTDNVSVNTDNTQTAVTASNSIGTIQNQQQYPNRTSPQPCQGPSSSRSVRSVGSNQNTNNRPLRRGPPLPRDGPQSGRSRPPSGRRIGNSNYNNCVVRRNSKHSYCSNLSNLESLASQSLASVPSGPLTCTSGTGLSDNCTLRTARTSIYGGEIGGTGLSEIFDQDHLYEIEEPCAEEDYDYDYDYDQYDEDYDYFFESGEHTRSQSRSSSAVGLSEVYSGHSHCGSILDYDQYDLNHINYSMTMNPNIDDDVDTPRRVYTERMLNKVLKRVGIATESNNT